MPTLSEQVSAAINVLENASSKARSTVETDTIIETESGNINSLPKVIREAEEEFTRRLDEYVATYGGSFTDGFTVQHRGQLFYYENEGKTFTYQWAGNPIFLTVEAGSHPSEYGMIGVDWIDKTEDTIRQELSKSSGASVVKTRSGLSVQDELDALSTGQSRGVISFTTLASLLAYQPSESEKKASYKVTSDPTTSLNGYYSWVSDSTYVKDASLVVNVISESNNSDAVSGAAVRRFVESKHYTSATENLLNEDASIAGYYIESTGAFVASASYLASDFIKVVPGVTYKLWKYSGGIVAGRARKSCYYNSDFNVVAGGSTNTISEFTVPSGVEYVRLSTFSSDYPTMTTTLVDSTKQASPQVIKYYPAAEINNVKCVSSDLYNPRVLSEKSNDDSVISRYAVQQLISEHTDNELLEFSKNIYKNHITNGDFIGGVPAVRNGSSYADINVDDLLLRGINKAVNQRTTGNEYVISDIGSDISNKNIIGIFVGYSDNATNLSNITSGKVYGRKSDGTLMNPAAIISQGKIQITANLYAFYQSITLPSLSTGFAVGTTVIPVDTTFYMSDFFATISDGDIDVTSVLKYFLNRGNSRFESNRLANVKQKPYVDFSKSNQVIVYGNKSTREINPFKNQIPNSSAVFNFISDYVGDFAVRENTGDDVAPVHMYGTTIGANHGYYAAVLTSSSHGKTAADIGSLYSHNGNTYVLAYVPGINAVCLMDIENNTDTYPSSGVFTYVSGGASTTGITVTAKSYQQIYPCESDYDMTVYVDDTEISNFSVNVHYKNNITFSESYNILSRQDVVAWYIGGATERGPIGGKKMLFSCSYRFDIDGNCTITGDYACADSFLIADIMGLQARSVDNLDAYYIPKTVGFTYNGSQINFALKAPSTTCTDAGGTTSIFFTSEKLDTTVSVKSDRWLQLGGGYTFALGFLPVGSAGADRTNNVTAHTMEIRSNTNKMYARLMDVNDFTCAVGDAWSFVGYRNVHQPFDGATATYPVRTNGDDYYFIDYHDTYGLVSIPMPDDYVGRNFEIVEQRNISVLSKVISKQLSCLVDCVGDYGYLVIKVSK